MNLARLQVTQVARSPISQARFVFAMYNERSTCGKSTELYINMKV